MAESATLRRIRQWKRHGDPYVVGTPGRKQKKREPGKHRYVYILGTPRLAALEGRVDE